MKKVYLFTEGSQTIGMGHLSRCSALYDQVAAMGHKPCFVVAGDGSAEAFLAGRRTLRTDWYGQLDRIDDLCEAYAIVDSYHATPSDYHHLAATAKRCLYIDDTDRFCYPKGVVLYGACPPKKAREQEAIPLSGSDYVILRPPFRTTGSRTAKQAVTDVLVLFGATDVAAATAAAVQVVLSQYDAVTVHVVTDASPSIPIGDGQVVHCYSGLSAQEMCALMNRCDLAISAAGQTVFELVSQRLPFVVVQVADNQQHNLDWLMSHRLVSGYAWIKAEQSEQEKQAIIKKLLADLDTKEKRQTVMKTMAQCDLQHGVENIMQALLGKED